MAQKRTRGGRRAGAGRPPKYDEPMVQCTVRLPSDWKADLIEDFGSLQAAIESLAKTYLGVDE